MTERPLIEYEMVALARDFSEYELAAGTVGCLCDLQPGADHGIVEFIDEAQFPLGGLVYDFALVDLRRATEEEVEAVAKRWDAVDWNSYAEERPSFFGRVLARLNRFRGPD